MAKPKIKLSLDRLTVPQRITFARTIATGILSSDLADKTALAATLTASADALETAQSDLDLTMRSVPSKTDARNGARDSFDSGMDALSTQIETETDFNAGIMTGIGFELASESRTPVLMTKLMNLNLSIGDHAGEIHLSFDPIAGARTYLPVYCVGENFAPNDEDWKSGIPLSRSNGDIEGLVSGSRVWVKVRAMGAGVGNLGAWSDPTYITVP